MTPNNSQHSIPEVCAKAIEYAKRGNEELVVCCGHLVMTRLIDAARAENRALTSSSLEKAKNKRLTTRKDNFCTSLQLALDKANGVSYGHSIPR